MGAADMQLTYADCLTGDEESLIPRKGTEEQVNPNGAHWGFMTFVVLGDM